MPPGGSFLEVNVHHQSDRSWDIGHLNPLLLDVEKSTVSERRSNVTEIASLGCARSA